MVLLVRFFRARVVDYTTFIGCLPSLSRNERPKLSKRIVSFQARFVFLLIYSCKSDLTTKILSATQRCNFGTIERLRFTFTPNGKREFVPRDQVFFLIVVYCLLLLLKNKYFHASFIHKNCSGQFLFSYFLFWEILNLNPTLAVRRKGES